MTVEEKAGQLNLLTGAMDSTGMKDSSGLEDQIAAGRCGAVLNVFTPAATRKLQEIAATTRLRIPLLFGYDVIHGHRTIFPIPLGLSCSWNPELLEKCARAAAVEAAAGGLHWVFSPMADISQDARWGRVAEGSGEDPWLGAALAAAMVRGYQDAEPRVAACVKHFALYGAVKAGREYNSVDMSRREMETTYFPPYRAAIDAGAMTAMTAFNDIDGIPASSNHWLLTDLLRGEWGFRGWVVTDYTAVGELVNHATAADERDAARQAFAAGADMDMVSEAFVKWLPDLAKSGEIPAAGLDAAVLRILDTKWEFGLFADPFSRCDEALPARVLGCPTHRDLARLAARESMVLLKNEGDLLPLPKDRNIALIGPLADNRRDLMGSWIADGDASEALSPLQGFQEIMDDRGSVTCAAGCGISEANADLLATAVRVAEQADIIVLVLGESWKMNGEAASRTDIRLPQCQRRLAERILATGKPCVLVTVSGRPLELSAEAGKFPAILHAWAPGSEGGPALAELVFGDAAPVGKLSMGFPRSVGQLPMTYRAKPTGRPFDPGNHYTTQYLDCPNDALFPFGHGLTYGSLEIGPPEIDRPEMPPGGTVTATVKITNHAPHPVTETLQLYLRDLVASVSRPVKELRGWQRVTLAPGESRTTSFPITDPLLAFPGPDFQPMVEPGEFEIMIGPDSASTRSVRFTRTAE